MNTNNELLQDQWSNLLSLLPDNLDEMAKKAGALDRKRKIKSADDLLRLVLASSLCEKSLREISAWAAVSGLGDLSNVAVLKRLRQTGDWLGMLITYILHRKVAFPEGGGNLRLRIMDASGVSRPGASGSDWRLHLGFDLATMSIDDAWLTSYKTGESLLNFSFSPGDVAVVDRIYANRRGIAYVRGNGADVIVRINLQQLPLLGEDGKPFDILEHARSLNDGDMVEWNVSSAPCKGIESIPGRLIIIAQESDAANRAQRRAQKKYQKRSIHASESVLEACKYVFLFTTLSPKQMCARDVADIYRFRWQIELEFKRLKSIVGLGELHTYTDDSCRVQLLGKILSALIIEELMRDAVAFSPCEAARSVIGASLCDNS
jgi:hypothetical protein